MTDASSLQCTTSLRPIHSILEISMAGADEHFALGLNLGGFILFIALIFICLPLCWLPFVISGCKAS